MDVHSRHVGDIGRVVEALFPTGTNLAGSTVQIRVTDRIGTALLTAAMTITNNTNPATATYTPTTSQLDVTGAHYVKVTVTYAGGAKETFPTPGYSRLLVEQ